ncbi:MAG: tyrosine-type recombinase/integrase [Legionellales bacterium]|nr:tyrosine-type recombinase/integrase [Legionellales bacterium]
MDSKTLDVELLSTHQDLIEGELDSDYIQAATSPNTREAYQRDVEHFLREGGQLPATPVMVEAYLRKLAPDYNPRTLIRRLTALRQWHKLKGAPDPTKSPLVTKTMRGIARLHGRPKQQALALRLSDLDQLVQYLDQQNSILSLRNKALLLLGFFGAFRRSELTSLKWEHVKFVRDGLMVNLVRSKTDQQGEGARVVVPVGNLERCPVRALLAWRQACREQVDGFIFKRFTKQGKILEEAITSRYWNRLLRKLAKEAGIFNWEDISSHSLRRGFATEAARLGASLPAIQKHGRWRTTRTVVEYVEAGRQFADSAVKVLFEYS